MQRKSTYAREMYAITEVVGKFRHYLYGNHFIIQTDQKSLHHLSDQVIQTPKQEEWLPKLLGFRYTIEYKPGTANRAADALSRSFAMAQSIRHTSLLMDIQQATREDTELSQLMDRCFREPVPYYTTCDGLLFLKDRVVIPSSATVIQQVILQELYTGPSGGHARQARTYARIASQFFWPHMRMDIKDYVAKCLIYQQAKHSHVHPAGLLQPLPIPTQIWEDIAMDFIVGLPPSHGFTVILVVIDHSPNMHTLFLYKAHSQVNKLYRSSLML